MASRLVAWHSGRTSVSGRRTSLVQELSCARPAAMVLDNVQTAVFTSAKRAQYVHILLLGVNKRPEFHQVREVEGRVVRVSIYLSLSRRQAHTSSKMQQHPPIITAAGQSACKGYLLTYLLIKGKGGNVTCAEWQVTLRT